MIVKLDKDQALAQLDLERERSRGFGGCVMCRLGSHQHAHEWIAENEHAVVTLDAYGATVGHLLVISKAHIERTSGVKWHAYQAIQHLVWQASQVLDTELEPQRVYTAALGAARPMPMSFPHFHVHVVPVYENDDRARPAHVFSWSAGVTCYSEDEARALRVRLRHAWPTTSGAAAHPVSKTTDC
ncbi:MAG TPA: HIT domain-containing protein [Polyangiaceae bacterium]|jgi:diadenosine tetraphosphate (Ap4A) HIT family hydrolase|nr:HIT domain-containing protein [Polyangiaceae bacterium]